MSAGFYHLRLAGVSHYQEALAGCSEGEPVRLFHEPDNPHDQLALRVESRWGELIGYVPRANWLRRAIFQDGRGVAASIAGIGRGAAGFLGAVISIAITDDDIGLRSYFPDREPPPPPPGGYRFWVDGPSAAEACERSAA
ncbi:HIRAN domain-containing protein [Rhizorhabdus histidinilytica]|uniref:HIRAN domain-containing protein n=1 Tax=Rhizorhabdus histidinilytica TaxID=439228 RepID=UPI003D2FD135